YASRVIEEWERQVALIRCATTPPQGRSAAAREGDCPPRRNSGTANPRNRFRHCTLVPRPGQARSVMPPPVLGQPPRYALTPDLAGVRAHAAQLRNKLLG